MSAATQGGVPDTQTLKTAYLSVALNQAPLTPYTTRFVLPSGKKLQVVTIGIGSGAGVLKAAVRFVPLAQGATLA